MTKTKLSPTQFDQQIGKKVAYHRQIKGMSQTELGAFLGVTFQQIQKYESGKNKVSTEALVRMCQIFKVDIHDFINQNESARVISKSDGEFIDHFLDLSSKQRDALSTMINVMT